MRTIPWVFLAFVAGCHHGGYTGPVGIVRQPTVIGTEQPPQPVGVEPEPGRTQPPDGGDPRVVEGTIPSPRSVGRAPIPVVVEPVGSRPAPTPRPPGKTKKGKKPLRPETVEGIEPEGIEPENGPQRIQPDRVGTKQIPDSAGDVRSHQNTYGDAPTP